MKQKDSIKKKKQKQQKEHVLLYKLLYSFMTMLVYMVGRNIPLYGINIFQPAYKVDAVDTTAAGDTFTGYFR